MDRPPLNILNISAMEELCVLLETLGPDPEVRVVLLTGEGRAFSAGVDVRDHTPDRVAEMTEAFHRLCMLLLNLPQPSLAVLNGMALGGGCELALCCDLVLAAEEAQIGQPEVKVGVFPPVAALLLPRLIGRKKALELLLTGESLSARQAEGMGLINRAVPKERLEEETQDLLDKLLGLSGAVLRLTKRAVALGLEPSFEEKLRRIDRLYLDELMQTQDASEGLNAYLEKRSPVWRHR